MFAQKLGRNLTLKDDDTGLTEYLLDEWWEQPHWLNHTIPVFCEAAVKDILA